MALIRYLDEPVQDEFFLEGIKFRVVQALSSFELANRGKSIELLPNGKALKSAMDDLEDFLKKNHKISPRKEEKAAG